MILPSLKIEYSGFKLKDLEDVLYIWGIHKFTARKISEGASRINWLIKTNHSNYILRNTGSDLDWLNWQIAVIEKLAKENFPYFIPQPLNTIYNIPYYHFKEDYWVVYKFIPGQTLSNEPTITQVYNVGVLVATYHKLIHDFQYENMAQYQLKLFDTDNLNRNFIYLLDYHNSSFFNDKTISQFIKKLFIFEKVYENILSSDILVIENLQKMPVHYDLHSKNILSSKDNILGLIDFDALGVGPKIIDFQNALIYMAGSQNGLHLPRIKSFITGYFSVWPLEAEEISVVYSLMIERLLVLISDILKRKCISGNKFKELIKSFLNDQDNFTSRLLSALIWLIHNKELFNSCLFDDSQSR